MSIQKLITLLGFLNPDDLRKAKEETKTFEKEFGGKFASERVKNYAFDLLNKLHYERRRAGMKEKESEERAREIFRTKQSK